MRRLDSLKSITLQPQVKTTTAPLDKIDEEEDDENPHTPLSGAGNKKGSGLNLKQ